MLTVAVWMHDLTYLFWSFFSFFLVCFIIFARKTWSTSETVSILVDMQFNLRFNHMPLARSYPLNLNYFGIKPAGRIIFNDSVHMRNNWSTEHGYSSKWFGLYFSMITTIFVAIIEFQIKRKINNDFGLIKPKISIKI